ncbi:uncharacterized protein (DUF2147 family) [Comamonas sp. BIGb0152]|uniref:DUF2147 domain-containing protein n=1 Tax=Comamonas sp. BIGb0152 TaxID=2940601 RepID=UPI002169176B|nr:DUF2147 domain-containing protein [Comamonas sp. BIGb0152]MCS4294693.1 uncharacterized protein (DUF2147 family) [Comamonas sp. BIGb0152]
MRPLIKPLLALAAGLAVALPALAAEMSPVGLWRTFDEKSGEPKSEVRISDSGGVLSGKVEKLLRKGADPQAVCDRCSDDRKGQPLLGLEIIRGAKQAQGKAVWEDGKILDPENGSSYSLKLTPTDNGNKLDVRGSIGPFGRTQTWSRVE